jgi:hypothetical protein
MDNEVLTAIPGMPGMMMMMVMVPSTATVAVTMNVTDYSSIVSNINAFDTSNSSLLTMHVYRDSDITKIYGAMLVDYAATRGWAIIYYPNQPPTGFSPWAYYSTDWPFMIDGVDIVQELNSINYRP